MQQQEPWQADLQARMNALSEALAGILLRQRNLEARLERLEKTPNFRTALTPDFAVREEPPAPAFPEPVPPPLPHIPAAETPRVGVHAAPPPLPSDLAATPPLRNFMPGASAYAETATRESGIEARLGLNWLNRVAVVTLILGAGFSFKYAVDNQWIGPGMRVALGILAGAASLACAEWMSLRGQKIFARGVTGLGLALLYLSFYATFGFYNLLPQSAAFLLMAATTVAAGALAIHYDSLAVGILGLLGGYLTPALLSTNQNRPWTLFGYLFLMNAGALVMARRGRWRAPGILAFVATTLYFAGWASRWFDDDMRIVATVAALGFYAQFAVAGLRELSQAAQMLTSAGVLSVWTDPSIAFPLAWAVLLGGLATEEWRKWGGSPAIAGLAFWLPVWMLWRVRDWTDRPAVVFLWFSLAFAALLGWVLWWSVLRKRTARAGELWLMATGAPVYFAACYALLNPTHHEYMGLLAALLAAVHGMLAQILWKPGGQADSYAGQISGGVAAVLLTLAVPIQFSGFSITVGWAIEAAACAWLAQKLASSRLTVAAVVLLTFVLVRLAAYDAEVAADTFLNARLLAFVVAAAGFLFASRCLAVAIGAAFIYCTGHLILLAGLILEVQAWAGRSAADIAGAASTGVSILTAVYGLALIGAGVVLRSALNRIFGLALLALVIVKLYLVDVWELSRGFRILAFLGLGALLLLVSYVYSRCKATMEKWWKDAASARTEKERA